MLTESEDLLARMFRSRMEYDLRGGKRVVLWYYSEIAGPRRRRLILDRKTNAVLFDTGIVDGHEECLRMAKEWEEKLTKPTN